MHAYPKGPPPHQHAPQQRRPSGGDRCQVIDMKPGLKNLNTKIIVLEKGKGSRVQAGMLITQFLVADPSGMIYLTLYDEKAEAVEACDIIEIRDGYCSLYKGALTLYVGKQGRISRVGEFMMTFDESVNVSHWEWHEPSPGEFVRLTREQADQMPQLQRNTHIINGVPFNTVPF